MNRADSLEQRLKTLYEGVSAVVDEFKPGRVIVEELYSHYKHPKTAVIMGHARGAIFLAAAQKNLPITSLSATEIKKGLTGSGRASKAQVRRCVIDQLGITGDVASYDVTDALAVALVFILGRTREIRPDHRSVSPSSSVVRL